MQEFQSMAMTALDKGAMRCAQERWDSIAKPVGSLGALEEAVVKIAGLKGNAGVQLGKRCVVVCCADNGVTRQGVSQSGADVTVLIARNAARGVSSINRMCEPVRVDVVPVDMGMLERVDEPKMRDCRIDAGTGDISEGPAMTRGQAVRAVRTGIDLVGELADEGYDIIATGEMGIGNTTTSTAMACAFTGMAPEELAGPGAGLPAEGVRHKAEVIRRALKVNAPDPSDPMDVLAKLGGFDIACLCGLFLGGAVYRVPIVVDGFISATAAYCAWRMRPECTCAMLASHLSAERAASVLLDQMGLKPIVHAGMRLGEGTGAVCLIPLLDMVLSLYRTGPTFADCGITSYTVDHT